MRRTLLVLLVLVAGGGWLIAGAGPDLRRAHVTSAGVPLDEVHPSASGPHPGGGRAARLRRVREADGGAVTRYAAAHPDVTATVAISLPDPEFASAEAPARLLTMAGALEFRIPLGRDQRRGRTCRTPLPADRVVEIFLHGALTAE